MAQRGRPKKLENIAIPEDKKDTVKQCYTCGRCGRSWLKQKGIFMYNGSPLYKGNNGFLNICNDCLTDIYNHYVAKLGSELEAIKRICLKFDYYFSPKAYEMTESTASVKNSRVGIYVSRLALKQYKNKTYDTNLDEETMSLKTEVKSVVPKKVVKFFGEGFDDYEYLYLDEQYNDWISRYECQSKAQEEGFKNLAMAQLNIVKAQRTGVKINEAMRTFQDLLGTMNIKPAQRNDNAIAEQNTFGTLIKKWEDEKPISEPKPEWKDVDGIVKYITVYFLGHLCKMMGINNKYAKMYEEEMSKYRVENPQYEDDDDETLFESVFGNSITGDGD